MNYETKKIVDSLRTGLYECGYKEVQELLYKKMFKIPYEIREEKLCNAYRAGLMAAKSIMHNYYKHGYGCCDKDAAELIENMAQEIDQLTLERDAAIQDLKLVRSCTTCKNLWNGLTCSKCEYEWRGVCIDNSGGDKE